MTDPTASAGATALPKEDFTTGICDSVCEITPEMQGVMEANSRALAEMMASPGDPAVPLRYRVGQIDTF